MNSFGENTLDKTSLKKRYMVNKVIRIPYETKAGRKYCEFYHDGFKKQSEGYNNVAACK